MHVLRLCLLSLGLLTASIPTYPQQQETSAGARKAEAPADSKAAPGPSKPAEKENWTSLADLKTGLEPAPPVVLQSAEQPGGFVRELVVLQWRPNDRVELWISRPKGAQKTPVILYLYGHTDSTDRFRNDGWCKRATSDGFAAVGFAPALTDQRYKGRPMKEWFISELPESVGSTVHDVQLILNYLAQRGDMDMDHVGVFGQGAGGAIAILAAKADPRIKTLDVLDPWGDWPDWFESSPAVPNEERPKYVTQEFLKSVAPLDPVAYLGSLKTPSFRFQQMASDPFTPKPAKARLAAALPEQAQVVKYAGPEDMMKAWKISGLSGWIKQQLRPNKAKEVATSVPDHSDTN
jgi:acetyl esterase/lipase